MIYDQAYQNRRRGLTPDSRVVSPLPPPPQTPEEAEAQRRRRIEEEEQKKLMGYNEMFPEAPDLSGLTPRQMFELIGMGDVEAPQTGLEGLMTESGSAGLGNILARMGVLPPSAMQPIQPSFLSNLFGKMIG